MMGVINEGLHDTSWENDEGDKITLMDLLNATEDIPVRKISVEELKPHLLLWDGDEDEVRKIESADLQYPILIFVNDDGEFITIIDGHHRAQKAARQGLETIRAKVIPINFLPKHIKRVFKHMMSEGKDAFVSRASFDQEYEEEYPKWGKTMVKFLDMAMNAYDENDNVIILFNDKDPSKTLMRYDKKNEQIWWDYSLHDELVQFVPFGYVSRHYRYAVQDYFKKHFPEYGVRQITGANIG
jgi:hypothetical protein